MPLPSLLDAIERLPAFARVINTMPAPRAELRTAGLPGSSDATLVAALARRLPTRFLVVVADGVPLAERILADLHTLIDQTPVALYPPREGFGEVEPHVEVAGERVETLERLGRGEIRILLTTPRALLERTRLPGALQDLRIELRKGDVRRPSELAEHLERIGFERVPMVEDVAQFSLRGGILDVYSFGMTDPVRLEFWGDEVVDLRHFELSSQRSTRAVDLAVVLPVDGQVREEATPGERLSISALFPPDTLLVYPTGTHLLPELQRTWDEAAHHIDLARRRGEDADSREELFESPEVAGATLSAFGALRLVDPTAEQPDVVFPFRAPETVDRDIKVLRRIVRDTIPTIVLCDNEGQCERLDELLNEDAREPSGAALVVGALGGGYILPPSDGERGLRVLTDHEIFRRERRIRRARRYVSGGVDSLALKPGDYVVHLEHGVGIYRGIETIFVGQSTIEVAVVEYEGGDRLNVPLYRLDQLERYRAGGEDGDRPPPRLHRLGGSTWQRVREKTRQAIKAMAAELLDLYARRQVASATPIPPDTRWQRELESSFLYEDTPDQRKATVEVKADMERPRPMDRLLVGDVGYGKTEVAVRAAFKAVQGGQQAAVLVPTTILAEQHGRTFLERLADYPVKVEVLSRFRTVKEQKQAIERLVSGQTDVVIGTHRLLSKDVDFKDLGLLIVDEEHRFGVKHKERLKQLRLSVHVLTLTATPIPRTLHLSLAGLRDLTLIETPPRDRSPILTFVEPWDDGLLEEAFARELDRGGQVFFVHNRIETIDTIAARVRTLAPRARVGVAHGQMPADDLEDVMRRFVGGEVDLLVSTMIVESGLDVPNANTMVIHDAHRFGLAQLYQLRGRVGRSHRRAYCYLLVPDSIDAQAEERLKVLEHHSDLGAGYRIALKDLELRGAGNLLGAEQSGHAHAVGFDLYMRWLEETVRALQGRGGAEQPQPPDVVLDRPAQLPDGYVPDDDVKLDLYRRLARSGTSGEIDGLRDEMRERFGPLPPDAETLLDMARLRVTGAALGLQHVLVRGDEARLTFRSGAQPRLAGLTAALDDVQLAAEVRRTVPLSLRLVRLGGEPIVPALVRALRQVA